MTNPEIPGHGPTCPVPCCGPTGDPVVPEEAAKEHRLVPAGWTQRIDHGYRLPGPGRVYSLHYADGTIRIEHTCKRVGDDQLITAPELTPGIGGHVVTQADPLTITPSILCPDCGLHGFITEGRWI